jgi:FRG domain-containing protein
LENLTGHVSEIHKNGISSVKDAIDIVCGGLNENGSYSECPKFLDDYFLSLETDKSFQYTYHFPWGIWFRGVSSEKYELLPSVLRPDDDGLLYKEGGIYWSFKLYNSSYEQNHQSRFDWLTLMQHYDLPTRLLDWSENILTALYFASNNSHKYPNDDGKLYILNARRLNRIYRFKKDKAVSDKKKNNSGDKGMMTPRSFEVRILTEFISSASKERILQGLQIDNRISWVNEHQPEILAWLRHETGNPDFHDMEQKTRAAFAIFPSRKNQRMQAQQSMFTLHGGKHYVDNEREYSDKEKIGLPIDLVILNNEETLKGHPFLMEFKVPYRYKENIREELRRIGIHHGFLYPEIEHQSKHLKSIWRFKK